LRQYKQQQRRRSVAAWTDIWRTEMKCAFPGPRQLRFAVLVNDCFQSVGHQTDKIMKC